MRRFILIGGAMLTMAAVPATAQSSAVAIATGAAPVTRPDLDGGYPFRLSTSRALIEQDYRYGLVRLRKAALQRQAADGGALTPVSIADLQAKLDRLNMVRARELRLLRRS